MFETSGKVYMKATIKKKAIVEQRVNLKRFAGYDSVKNQF